VNGVKNFVNTINAPKWNKLKLILSTHEEDVWVSLSILFQT
jgi:hypothetical protein